jgi:hypothetical protein
VIIRPGITPYSEPVEYIPLLTPSCSQTHFNIILPSKSVSQNGPFLAGFPVEAMFVCLSAHASYPSPKSDRVFMILET